MGVGLHIYIDESGTFICDARKRHSISAVGALVIPTSSMKGFEKLYGRLRRRLPQNKGEIKGRQLSEDQVVEVAALLRKVGSIFEVVAIDMGMHSEEDILLHKASQEEAITAHLTPKHQPKLVEQVRELRSRLEAMPLQLYAQSVAMAELVYHTLNYANVYHAFHRGQELAEYHWTVDAKDRLRVTPWEEWWLRVILPMLESHSFREPFIVAEGGDCRWHERFRTEPDEYKLQFVRDPGEGEFFDLRLVMMEDFRFSPDPELGLEAADILTNTVRRSLSGHFERRGWMALPQLMIHRKNHYIRLISLSQEERATPRAPYTNVINDFRSGGRPMLPDKFSSD